MTESVFNVYDLLYPSPITLKKISSIVIVVELWREEICAQVASKRLQELDLKNNIQVKTVLPSLPSTIYSLLEEYVDTFRKSILQWQELFHYRNVFDHNGSMNFLSRFNDFAWDWDGTIHFIRSAKRMMLCDRLTDDEKFKIACLYCFEDDIKQIWPSVSETKDLNKINSRKIPVQYYWICYLRNELHKLPNRLNFNNIDMLMIFISGKIRNPAAVMYFWNRLPSDSHSPKDVYVNLHWPELFARFILPKLNEHQLDVFVAEKGMNLMKYLLRFAGSEPELVCVLPTWMYIRSRIDIGNFSDIIRGLLVDEVISSEQFPSRKYVAFNEIWTSAPQHFKRSVLDDVLGLYYNEQLSDYTSERISNNKGLKFLIRILQDTTFEERNAFWHKNCRLLFFWASVEDLVFMMKWCFRNENEITLFKENFTSKYENIAVGCAPLMENGMFEELNDALSLCCLDEQTRKELKRRLLRSHYVGENSVLTACVVMSIKLLNEFIDDAFQDAADLGVEFRNQVTSSPVTETSLLECIRNGDFVDVMEFVDTFYADAQVVVPLKKRLFEHFKEHLIANDIEELHDDHRYSLRVFLIWLLGSEDEVIRFKQSIQVEEIFRTMMQAEWEATQHYIGFDFKPEFPQNANCFLLWYFNEDEDEIEKFMKLFVNEFDFERFDPRIRKTV